MVVVDIILPQIMELEVAPIAGKVMKQPLVVYLHQI